MAIKITKNVVSKIISLEKAEQFNALIEKNKNNKELKDFFKEVLDAPQKKEVILEEIKMLDGTYVPSNILLLIGGSVASIHVFKVDKNNIYYDCKVEKKKKWVYREPTLSKKEKEKRYYSRRNRSRV